jgi:ribosomal protein S18 acetylase RimI-like enzyme
LLRKSVEEVRAVTIDSTFDIRLAVAADLPFLAAVDLADEGITAGVQPAVDIESHAERLRSFVDDRAAAAWVVEAGGVQQPVALIMCRFRDLCREPQDEANEFLLRYVSRATFPADGRFAEIYQLWVDPRFRRRGLAFRLKRHVELESLRRSMSMIYTHTEARNHHVLALNQKLGYRQVRTGVMWDEIERISLVKDLG